jgi:multidrug efflux system membrane fusion protein
MRELSSSKPSSGEPSPGTSWKAVVVAVVCVAAVVALLWFWRFLRSEGPGWQPPGALDVVAMRVAAEPAPVRLEALGEVRAARQVTLSSEAGGRVSVISFEPGQRVGAGDVLLRLDDAVEQADLAAARANALFARQRLERAAELVVNGAVSRETLQQRQAEHDQAAAQARQLEARIRQKQIRAPFAGELGLRQVDLGQYVNAGERVVTLTDLETLYIHFDVPQQQLARLEIGQTVEVRSDAADAKVLHAHISAIEPQIGRDTRNVTVQATLKNEGRALWPGMYVTAAVVLPSEPGALLTPVSAIMTAPSGDAVAVVRELSADMTGKVEIVPVTTGRRLDDRVVVTRGLHAGDVVVTEGQVRLQPGAAVRVTDKAAQDQNLPSGGER